MSHHPPAAQDAGRSYRDSAHKSSELNTSNSYQSSQHLASSGVCFQQLLRKHLGTSWRFRLSIRCVAPYIIERHERIH
jgi:hypothetical protein